MRVKVNINDLSVFDFGQVCLDEHLLTKAVTFVLSVMFMNPMLVLQCGEKSDVHTLSRVHRKPIQSMQLLHFPS